MLPSTPKKVRKVLQIVLHAGSSLVFLGIGSVSAGLLYCEESVPKDKFGQFHHVSAKPELFPPSQAAKTKL